MLADSSNTASRHLQDLSFRVLLYAAKLAGSMECSGTASLLYSANSMPLTPSWLQRMPNDEAVLRHLLQDEATDETLKRSWMARQDRYWLYWHPRKVSTKQSARFKLYVSTMPNDASRAMAVAVEVMAEHGTPNFKVARSPRSLLRSDRMVAYYHSRDELRAAAQALAHPIAGFPAQGVPFTPGAYPSGVLSWGYDPPPSMRRFASSWRHWLSKKLAAYLHAADAANPNERVGFALRKLAEDGVEPQTWEPRPSLWS